MYKERINYYDTLRVLAILGIISTHVFQRWPNAMVSGISIYSFIEITRFAVPIFLMLSGALLLNREMPIKTFLKRRFPRLTYPFIFYMILYVAILTILMHVWVGFEGLSVFFQYLPLSYNWYFWMIASVYLSIPIIDKFIQNSNIKEIEYFVIIALLGSLFYQITYYFNIVHFINLNFFVGPLAYIVIGYYLSIKSFKYDENKILIFALSIFVLTTLLKISGQLGVVPMGLLSNYEAAKSTIVSSYLDFGFIEMIRSISLFIFFRYLYQSSSSIFSKIRKFLEEKPILSFNQSVSKASYGMYLFHNTLIEPLIIIAPQLILSGTETALLIVLLSLAFFFISWIVVLIINRMPIIKNFSGYH